MAKVISWDLSKSALRSQGLCMYQSGDGYRVKSLPRAYKGPLSSSQLRARELFKKASEYAKELNRDQERKAAYAATLPPGASVYKAAFKEHYQFLQNQRD